jgi:hypothetical protein
VVRLPYGCGLFEDIVGLWQDGSLETMYMMSVILVVADPSIVIVIEFLEEVGCFGLGVGDAVIIEELDQVLQLQLALAALVEPFESSAGLEELLLSEDASPLLNLHLGLSEGSNNSSQSRLRSGGQHTIKFY